MELVVLNIFCGVGVAEMVADVKFFVNFAT